jgi:hypothetical protein
VAQLTTRTPGAALTSEEVQFEARHVARRCQNPRAETEDAREGTAETGPRFSQQRTSDVMMWVPLGRNVGIPSKKKTSATHQSSALRLSSGVAGPVKGHYRTIASSFLRPNFAPWPVI